MPLCAFFPSVSFTYSTFSSSHFHEPMLVSYMIYNLPSENSRNGQMCLVKAPFCEKLEHCNLLKVMIV